MKKVTAIRKALSYAKYLSETVLMNIISNIANSTYSSNGYGLDEIITREMHNHDKPTGDFIRQWLRDNACKNIYLHPDIPVGIKEYFIDTALDNLLEENITETMDINFDHMDKRLTDIIEIFLTFSRQ